jgi:Iap family predicted aminopeptidase
MAFIKSNKIDERAKSRSTPFGQISFDEKGVAEVEQSVADHLCKISPSLTLVSDQGSSTPETDTPETDTPETDIASTPKVENAIQESVEEESKDQLDEVRQSLDHKSMSEIRQILKDAGIEEEEFEKEEFKGKEGKPALIEFVIQKLH